MAAHNSTAQITRIDGRNIGDEETIFVLHRLTTRRLMRLPDDVLAAKAKTEVAEAALRADIESDDGDRVKRIRLIDDLQLTTDECMDKIDRSRVRPPRECN